MAGELNDRAFIRHIDLAAERAAEADAMSIVGVKRVRNSPRVRPSDRVDDETLEDWAVKEDIEDQFFWSPFVDAEDIIVTVEDGVAHLTGTVSSWAERRDATENALEGGARRVDNDLAVAEGG